MLGYRGPSHRLAMKVVLQTSTSGRVLRPLLLGMVLFILSSALSGTAEAQKLPTTPPPTSSKISSGPETAPLPAQTEQAIPLPQIADRANELQDRKSVV